jgi:hypothetical protein
LPLGAGCRCKVQGAGCKWQGASDSDSDSDSNSDGGADEGPSSRIHWTTNDLRGGEASLAAAEAVSN